jgi:hypothetical protein
MMIDWRKQGFFKIAAGFAVTVFVLTGYAFAADTARIAPSGKVAVYQADKKIDELRAEAPLPYDSLLTCDGQCQVHLNSMYLVATPETAFRVGPPPRDNLIAFLSGKFYFSLHDLPRQLVFKTPIDDFTVQRVVFQTAASGGRLDGYIFVQADRTEIGVLQGGSLVVSSSQGEHLVRSGNQITLAQAGGEQQETNRGTAGAVEGASNNTKILVGGLVGAAAIAGSIALISNGGSDGPPPASPNSP